MRAEKNRRGRHGRLLLFVFVVTFISRAIKSGRQKHRGPCGSFLFFFNPSPLLSVLVVLVGKCRWARPPTHQH